MSNYVRPSGRHAVFTLYDLSGRELSEVEAVKQGLEPFREVPHKVGGPLTYPSYEAVTANGITEIVEHKEMRAIFYINDDPDIRAKILSKRQ